MDKTKENFITRMCPFCKALMKNKIDSYEEKMRRITNVSRCAICGELFKEEKEKKMTTVYPQETTDKFIIKENSSFNKEKIDQEVKELRKQGFKVKRKKFGNIEGSGEIYSYEARKKKE